MRVTLAGLAAFAVVFVANGANGWSRPAANEQAIGEVSRWCERVSDGLLREPVNTLGNLGFVVAGLAMFGILARDTASGAARRNRFIGNTSVSLLYTSAAVLLGPGSMVMHGTHTRFGAWIDNVSMVAYILIPWLLNVATMARWRDRTMFSTYGASLGAYMAGYWFFGPDLGIGLDLFAASVGIWVTSEVLYRFWTPAARWWSGLVGLGVGIVFGITPATIAGAPDEYWWVALFWLPGLLATNPPPGRRRYTPWYWAGSASFVVAYSIWLTGKVGHPWCDPDSLIQGHAIWHLLSALATFSFFMFLRTEQAIGTGAAPPDEEMAVSGR